MVNTRKEPEKKQNNREYHVQNKNDSEHQHVKTFCSMTQFPELQFCGPHTKPNGVGGLGKHYHVQFYPDLGHI